MKFAAADINVIVAFCRMCPAAAELGELCLVQPGPCVPVFRLTGEFLEVYLQGRRMLHRRASTLTLKFAPSGAPGIFLANEQGAAPPFFPAFPVFPARHDIALTYLWALAA